MVTEVHKTLVTVKSDRDYQTVEGKKESVYFEANWSNGKLLSIHVTNSYSWLFNDIFLNKQSLHAFYEVVDELKTLTNNPPVGCEPV